MSHCKNLLTEEDLLRGQKPGAGTLLAKREPASLSPKWACVEVGHWAALCQGLACGPQPVLTASVDEGPAPALTPFSTYV